MIPPGNGLHTAVRTPAAFSASPVQTLQVRITL